MLRASKRVIVLSEKVNRFGFRALVKGVDLTYYNTNPLMLWMHKRAFVENGKSWLPIGNVIELKIEDIEGVGLCITGQPVFDDTDDFAKAIYNKFENGTLRMASAGLIPVEWSEEEGLLILGQTRPTLIKSVLEEISMVDMGADTNALAIALYNEDHELIQLSAETLNAQIPLLTQPLIDNEMKKIELSAARASQILGLKETDTPEAYEAKIDEVVQLAATQKTQIETLTREKKEAEDKAKDAEVKLAVAEKAAKEEAVNTYLSAKVEARVITEKEKKSFSAIALAHGEGVEKGLEAVKAILDERKPSETIETKLAASLEQNQKDRLAELVKLSYDELFEKGWFTELKTLSAPDAERKYAEKFPNAKK
ncbi:hypothetical protein [Pedobacter sp. SL55]|uniref:hypothetical protein n=1 Tax=Pedobacter sp. SL55 TaxID=2995161 RepID=UPI0022700BE0|nr:hypothetical protein [Pedobacter sp. SL55]WAC40576.1 hypothetical protein OVA16_18725 [Pedobacter sp. SL55]